MFERRLKTLLIIISLMVLVLIGRAAQVQVIQRNYWKGEATKALKRAQYFPTSRGDILDYKGRVLATDKPCIDACVDYRALLNPPDKEWLRQRAIERLKARLGEGWDKLSGKQRTALREQETAAMQVEIDQMWPKLALASNRPLDEIMETREAIVHRVQMLQRSAWYRKFEEAVKKQGGTKIETNQWTKWLTEGGSDAPPVDAFEVVVSDQTESHVILHAIDTATQNDLGKNIDRYPGLVLRPGTHRYYPYSDVACHVIGNLSRVNGHEVKIHPSPDDLRAYLPNDQIGRNGVEALCEPALRGSRGRTDKELGEETVLGNIPAVPGQNVRLTIDIELQQQIQSVFASTTLRDSKGHVEEGALLHGAAIVLDVNTNEVRAMVSYPTYDLNHRDELYTRLLDDEINDPLRNRATMSQLEPGSTIKPLCGLAAITQGVLGVNEGIECTGYLILDGHPLKNGRCWVASRWEGIIPTVSHHPVPYPHEGHDGNLDGHLTYSDALERSCNVFFETTADRLGIELLSEWYEKFGLGRPTGIGITEFRGRLPSGLHVAALRRSTCFFGGIGQGYVAATPIQMANAAAMIARDGVLMRPRLIAPSPDGKLPEMRQGTWQKVPERVDLHLPPAALAAAKDGMFRVVHSKSGTGTALVAGDKLLQRAMICGKTGTAQAARFSIKARDAAGNVIKDEKGKDVPYFPEPSTREQPNPLAPWYRATIDDDGKLNLKHSWYIGFAPADKPQVAFAVMVEYGGSGGGAAASVARESLVTCIERGYLHVKPAPPEPPADAQSRAE
ncbi:MAG: spoVD [Phycisphaerales bacterium]|nr:spoVD [Phycisphaerales bacterium]